MSSVADITCSAVGTGALIQFRVLGGALGLAIGSGIANNHLESKLRGLIGSQDLSRLIDSLQSSGNFTVAERAYIKEAFAQSFSLEVKMMIGFAAAQVLAIALLWHWPQILLLNQTKQHRSVDEGVEKQGV